MRQNNASDLRLMAFAERSQEKSAANFLHIYIVNESPAALGILNELDSINVPQNPPGASGTVPDADLTHIDFGVSGSATFIQVPSGECVKTTLLLNEQQLAMVARARYMKTAVKFRAGGNDKGAVTTALLPATVYKVNP
jgi:hypothetical protein